MEERINSNFEGFIIIMVSAYACLAIGTLLFFPVVVSVNKQKDQVLSMFCEISYKQLELLQSQTLKFLHTVRHEDKNDEIASVEDLDNLHYEREEEDSFALIGVRK